MSVQVFEAQFYVDLANTLFSSMPLDTSSVTQLASDPTKLACELYDLNVRSYDERYGEEDDPILRKIIHGQISDTLPKFVTGISAYEMLKKLDYQLTGKVDKEPLTTALRALIDELNVA